MIRATALAALGLAAAAPSAAQEEAELLRGQIRPVNPQLTDDAPIGEVEISLTGPRMRVMIDGEGFAPMVHMVHVHGFAESDPAEAECPSPAADANGDGVIDIAETREDAGVTLIPLTADPVSLDLEADSYPAADEQGELDVIVEADREALDAALLEAKGATAAMPRRVIMIHGVMSGAGLPDGAASVGGMPVAKTIPIACAELSAEE
jgi:hypothetical protein